MQKQKYKLGTLVSYNENEPQHFGIVTAVVHKTDSFSYRLENGIEVTEDLIGGAFKSISPRGWKAAEATQQNAPGATRSVRGGKNLKGNGAQTSVN